MYRAVLLKTRSIGTIPSDLPFVPLMIDPAARMFEQWTPIPPDHLEIWAHSLSVSKIPSTESSFIATRKHELIWGLFVPALNRVGVACVKYLADMR